MDKSPEAFRTISEVAEALDTPAHVLRFWESRFPQIRPVKRAGGRRYYRPADVALLTGIRHLLHEQGITIRGVQKILREQGVRHVASLVTEVLPVDEEEEKLEASLEALRGKASRLGDSSEPAEGAEIVAMPKVDRSGSPPEDGTGAVLHLYSPLPASPALTAPRSDGLGEPDQIESEPKAAEEAPEASHIWVDDEPELDLSLSQSGQVNAPENPAPAPRIVPQHPTVTPKPPKQEPALGSMFDDIFPGGSQGPGVPLQLSGLAARIRALPRPLSPEALLELTELHSRLGLLHAQIAEALNSRR